MKKVIETKIVRDAQELLDAVKALTTTRFPEETYVESPEGNAIVLQLVEVTLSDRSTVSMLLFADVLGDRRGQHSK